MGPATAGWHLDSMADPSATRRLPLLLSRLAPEDCCWMFDRRASKRTWLRRPPSATPAPAPSSGAATLARKLRRSGPRCGTSGRRGGVACLPQLRRSGLIARRASTGSVRSVLVFAALAWPASSAGSQTAPWNLVPSVRIGEPLDAETGLTRVGHVVHDRDRILISQPDEHHLRVFSSDGGLLGIIGRRGQGPGEFEEVSRVGLHGDEVWVSDGLSGRVSFFDALGFVPGRGDTGRVATAKTRVRNPSGRRPKLVVGRTGRDRVRDRESRGSDRWRASHVLGVTV